MTNINDLVARRDALRREFDALQASTPFGSPRTPEEKAETARILAEAKQLDADIDAYMLENNIKHDPTSSPSKGNRVNKFKNFVSNHKAEIVTVSLFAAAGAVYGLTRSKRIDILLVIQDEKSAEKVAAIGAKTLRQLVEFWDQHHTEAETLVRLAN